MNNPKHASGKLALACVRLRKTKSTWIKIYEGIQWNFLLTTTGKLNIFVPCYWKMIILNRQVTWPFYIYKNIGQIGLSESLPQIYPDIKINNPWKHFTAHLDVKINWKLSGYWSSIWPHSIKKFTKQHSFQAHSKQFFKIVMSNRIKL